MLHRMEPGLSGTELRPTFALDGALHRRRNPRLTRQVVSAKDDPVSAGGRTKGESAGVAEVQANALDGDRSTDRLAPVGHSAGPSERSMRLSNPASLKSAAVARSDSRCG